MATMNSFPASGDFSDQIEWHESYRDAVKNMYRTTYSDMTHGREVNVKSDYPAGYGGHVPSVRHDVFFRNTAFDRTNTLRRNDPSRDAFPSFEDHLAGIPTSTKFPQGAKKTPTYGVVPHDGTTTTLKPPWGTATTQVSPLNYRSPPPSMVPSSRLCTPRVNRAAKIAGSLLTSVAPEPEVFGAQAASGPPPGSSQSGVQKTVSLANEMAYKGRMPTELEIIAGEVQP
eukprot:TRINITY_DN2660_c0_g5_i1.p1 TRINITY_DN2660_c0_g5~~TRINITY_DN2660_c0_g5_i1.p1  ORF type:complete len:228 (-),score=43.02 TRINITY_DN2660_c0_g5_i1:124-807(-)